MAVLLMNLENSYCHDIHIILMDDYKKKMLRKDKTDI